MTDQDLRIFNELMNSWAVQGILAAFLLGLVIVAFTRASLTFDDDRTRRTFRVAVAALGVLVVLQAVATAALGHIPFPPIPQVIEPGLSQPIRDAVLAAAQQIAERYALALLPAVEQTRPH